MELIKLYRQSCYSWPVHHSRSSASLSSKCLVAGISVAGCNPNWKAHQERGDIQRHNRYPLVTKPTYTLIIIYPLSKSPGTKSDNSFKKNDQQTWEGGIACLTNWNWSLNILEQRKCLPYDKSPSLLPSWFFQQHGCSDTRWAPCLCLSEQGGSSPERLSVDAKGNPTD